MRLDVFIEWNSRSEARTLCMNLLERSTSITKWRVTTGKNSFMVRKIAESLLLRPVNTQQYYSQSWKAFQIKRFMEQLFSEVNLEYGLHEFTICSEKSILSPTFSVPSSALGWFRALAVALTVARLVFFLFAMKLKGHVIQNAPAVVLILIACPCKLASVTNSNCNMYPMRLPGN